MSLESHSIPGLFGGVSQQIPAMRHATQCEEQRNCVATVVDGLFSRPGTQHLVNLPLGGVNGSSVGGSNGEAFGHYIPRPDGSLYILVLVNGNFMVYDARSDEIQATSVGTTAFSYLSSANPSTGFACLTLGDYTFIVNTSKQPAMLASSAAPLNPTGRAYIDVRTAVANVNYQVTIDGFTATFSTPPTVSAGMIADQLATALVSGLGAGYTVLRLVNTNVIKVVRASGVDPAVTCYDSWDNDGLRILSAGVPVYADLPPTFETGYTLTITGTAENQKDQYYVKWQGGKWTEAPKPGRLTKVDPSTLPHQLYRNPLGSWILEAVPDWADRLAGDDNTTPDPSFLDAPIRDIFFYRNRLGFLAGPSAVLSRAGDYFSFFPRTATQILDNDPIDLTTPVDGVNYLAWAVPFNRNLLIWTDAKQQLVLTGGIDALSPKNAQLAPASTFVADPAARPAPLGNRAIFAERNGVYSALAAYRVAYDTVTNVATPLTDHLPRFIPASPRALYSSTASRMVLAVPSAASHELQLLRYELDPDGEQFSQKSWSQVVFESAGAVRTLAARWDNHKLYLLMHYTSPTDPLEGGRFASEVIDFQRDVREPGLDFALYLDRKMPLGHGTYSDGPGATTFTVPWYDANMVFYRVVAGQEPLELLPLSLSQSSWGSIVSFAGDLSGAALWCGVPYTSRYTFTEALLRDKDGIPIQAATVKLSHYLIKYIKAGRIQVEVTPHQRETYTYQFGGRQLGVAGQGAGQLAPSSGEFRVPVSARADGTRVSIVSTSPIGFTIPYAEWIGDIAYKAQRR